MLALYTKVESSSSTKTHFHFSIVEDELEGGLDDKRRLYGWVRHVSPDEEIRYDNK